MLSTTRSASSLVQLRTSFPKWNGLRQSVELACTNHNSRKCPMGKSDVCILFPFSFPHLFPFLFFPITTLPLIPVTIVKSSLQRLSVYTVSFWQVRVEVGETGCNKSLPCLSCSFVSLQPSSWGHVDVHGLLTPEAMLMSGLCCCQGP